jgi:hypothetical protein
MSYSFTRGLEFCIHESLVFGKATKSEFFLLGFYGNGISDYGIYGLESYVSVVNTSHNFLLHITLLLLSLSLDGSIFLPTLPNNLQMSLNEAEYYILPSPYLSCSLNYRACLACPSEI